MAVAGAQAIRNYVPPEPVSDTVFAGEQVTMSSTVISGADTVVVTVLDSSGAPHYSVTLHPDADGLIQFSWFPLFDGTFTVSAESFDDGQSLISEILGFVQVVRPEASGFVTGGGWFEEFGGKSTFGFVAQVMRDGRISGNLQFQDHASRWNWNSSVIDWVYAESPTKAYFSGWATRDRVQTFRFFAEVVDAGEPGRSDTLSLWVYDPVTGALQFHYSDYLTGGNIQIHRR